MTCDVLNEMGLGRETTYFVIFGSFKLDTLQRSNYM